MEYSGRVRDAFRAEGHDAISCDFHPTEVPGPHIQGNVFDVNLGGYDMLIAFPDCTYVCGSGLHWNGRVEGRAAKTDEAVALFKRLWDAPVNKKCFENPVGCLSTRFRKPDQIIQPWHFYDDASKATCLWLDGVPKLRRYGAGYPPRITKEGKKRWGNQTDSGQNNLAPSDDRWKERSRTYQGIADAMALQWGGVFA